MTKRTRTLLFFCLGAIFFATAPAIILYSQGYRFDPQKRWFSKVGAFYFQVTPPRAEIFINEKPIGQTARIIGSLLTENFAPGSYDIRIEREGYHSWSKRLEIVEKQVTEAKHVLLLPEDPTFLTLQGNVQALWFSPSKSEAVLQKSNPQHTWTLTLWDIENNVEYPIYQSPRSQDQIWDIVWAWNSQALLIRIASQEQIQSFIQPLDRASLARQKTVAESLQAAAQTRVSLSLQDIAHASIAFSPFQENHILFRSHKNDLHSLMQFDYVRQQTFAPLAQDIIAFFVNNTQVIWLDAQGNLWQKRSEDSPPFQLNKTPIDIQTENLYTIYEFANEFFVQTNEALFMLNPQTKEPEELFFSLKEIVLSPDGKKLALSNGKEIWLFYVSDEHDQPSHRKGAKVFLTRFGEEITNLIWLNAHYLLFAKGDDIFAIETDTRDRLNIAEVTTVSRPFFIWYHPKNSLLVKTNNEVRISESLLP